MGSRRPRLPPAGCSSLHLEKGQKYQYTLKATVMRDGKPVQAEQPVIVRSGEESQVTLKLPATSVAAR